MSPAPFPYSSRGTRNRVAILGSTGSIGANTLKVISSLGKHFEVVGLSADSNITLLARQARLFRPRIVSVRDAALAAPLRTGVPARTKVVWGRDGLEEIVSRSDVDIVVCAISGSSCLRPLLRAIECKKRIALANKESLVAAGALVMESSRRRGVDIIPVDSEHSAIFQCLDGKAPFLNKIYLTGSGGPLLDIPASRFETLSKKFVLRHPKWRMGKKISVDSATMMNKGLEIIEARWLFGIGEKSIEVLIHPEAIVHSMIELIDGTVFAQLGVPDMRIPIQYALTYPARVKNGIGRVRFRRIKNLSFRAPDEKKFPCLRLAREALRSGRTYPAVLNAANEEAVKYYLELKMPFCAIPKLVEKVLERHRPDVKGALTLDAVIDAEEWARGEAARLCCR